MKALSIAASGMNAQQLRVEVISNNIANSATTGFKAGRAAFADLTYQSMDREGTLNGQNGSVRPIGIDIGMGVQTAGVVRLHSQGTLEQTSNPLDIAIQGKGYFVVNRPDGSIAFTRDGSFQISPEGEIVTIHGHQIDPGIVVPDDALSVEINEEGVIMAYLPGDMEPEELGQLTLATFVNDAGLKTIGDNLMMETAASGEAMIGNPGDEGYGGVKQGWLEASNVSVVEQITSLIEAQRGYEMNSKTVRTVDEMMSSANQIK